MLLNPMPNRRQSETFRLPVGEAGKEQTFFVTLGIVSVGNRLVINEVFLKHGKEGQALDAICDDAGIIISKLLQTGFPVADLCPGISILPVFDAKTEKCQPASILGATLQLIATEQQVLDKCCGLRSSGLGLETIANLGSD
ncbi:hypothetical protein [Kiloniella sp.]|uniref:hypothetical protein n=1 Tax=Kiloniella sp. TaxID=1938587 RepID=UPI003B017766